MRSCARLAAVATRLGLRPRRASGGDICGQKKQPAAGPCPAVDEEGPVASFFCRKISPPEASRRGEAVAPSGQPSGTRAGRRDLHRCGARMRPRQALCPPPGRRLAERARPAGVIGPVEFQTAFRLRVARDAPGDLGRAGMSLLTRRPGVQNCFAFPARARDQGGRGATRATSGARSGQPPGPATRTRPGTPAMRSGRNGPETTERMRK